jgi:hypothetical protein
VERRHVSIFVVLMLGPQLAAYALRWPGLKRIANVTTAVGLALVVVMSGYFVARYEVLYETHHNFDRDEFFDR